MQWTFPRYRSTCVFPTSSNSWWNAKPLSGNAEPQKQAANLLGLAWYIWRRFCKSNSVFFSTLSAGVESIELSYIRTNSLITGGEEWESNTSSGSEMPARTVSQKFSHPLWGRFFKELWCRPTTTAEFRSSFWQIPYTSHVRLLEDQIQDRGMYLFTISNGSYALDQRSGDGWFSGWFKKLRHLYGVFQCRILKYLMRGLLQRWTKSSITLTSKEESVWRNKRPRSRTVSFAASRLLTWSTITSGSLEPMILSKTTPTCSPLYDENRTWWYLGRIVQIKNSRVWETQDRIGIVWPGDSSEEIRTWLSQIENYGDEKYRARHSNEKNAVVKNQGTEQCGQRILGDGWQWEANGQCVKGDSCSFLHDILLQHRWNDRSKRKPFYLRKIGVGKVETHDGDEPSIDRTGWPVVRVFGTILRGTIFIGFNHFVTGGSFTADGGLL